MEIEQYDLMSAAEERHWWYVGMRRIAAALLRRYPPLSQRPAGQDLEILDAGCGTGGTTRFLERYGVVTGVDLSPRALELARKRGLSRLARSSVSEMPFRDGSFDLVASFDVLYHLDVTDDRISLAEMHRVLRPGGIVLIRLPAFDWIRGAHDEVVHTRHRYTRDEIRTKLQDAGFHVEHATYANFLLFPVARAKRYFEHRKGSRESTDLWIPPAPINRLLVGLLSLEALLARGPGLPRGLSVFAVGRRVQPLSVSDVPRQTDALTQTVE